MSQVREFWDDQARLHSVGDKATAPDSAYRELEINRVIEQIPANTKTVLDVGCGNGFSTLRYAEARPEAFFLGVDYSELMVNEAMKARMKAKVLNVTFDVADIKSGLPGCDAYWDVITSVRCLINLSSWDEQKAAILEMKKGLAPTGRLILVENTQEGLERLNALRTGLDLQAIKTRWHNLYLPEVAANRFLHKHFNILAAHNIGNLYYIISRVVNAKLAALEGREPSYEDEINKVAAKLPSLETYNYSPNMMWVLENK